MLQHAATVRPLHCTRRHANSILMHWCFTPHWQRQGHRELSANHVHHNSLKRTSLSMLLLLRLTSAGAEAMASDLCWPLLPALLAGLAVAAAVADMAMGACAGAGAASATGAAHGCGHIAIPMLGACSMVCMGHMGMRGNPVHPACWLNAPITMGYGRGASAAAELDADAPDCACACACIFCIVHAIAVCIAICCIHIIMKGGGMKGG